MGGGGRVRLPNCFCSGFGFRAKSLGCIVWVRTDRNITVLVEDAKSVSRKGESEGDDALTRGLHGMEFGGLRGLNVC